MIPTARYTMLSDPAGEILFKAMLAPEVLSSLSWAEVALGISLRYLVPLLLHFTLVAGFFLAIILNPYSRLRMLASKDPGVPQDVSRMWRWQLQRMGPAKAPPNHHIDKIIDLCLLLQPVRSWVV
ncbi:PKD_channel domain-containing protein [Haematococcus lacustris]|uniref:PKD_channel domain-containing protein n=1 Tax=Haematococcus lacustris TaxID=44745 RepID=A0A6A0A595_HAELA|nr:PKD_channel domain-containing protein [Haematococcus lacustris]